MTLSVNSFEPIQKAEQLSQLIIFTWLTSDFKFYINITKPNLEASGGNCHYIIKSVSDENDVKVYPARLHINTYPDVIYLIIWGSALRVAHLAVNNNCKLAMMVLINELNDRFFYYGTMEAPGNPILKDIFPVNQFD